jgi:uncharacterized glyoxalase superfamily protein PhnB
MLGWTSNQRPAINHSIVEGGRINLALEKQFWGAYHGSLTDKVRD